MPDDLIDQREDIHYRLNKDEPAISDNPTKEDFEKFAAHQTEIMKTDVWKEWTEWIAESKKLIKNYPRLEEETEISNYIIKFYQSGRNIFEISSFLIELLKNTDVGNIRFKDFVLPYDNIYFHFGGLSDIEYPVECYELRNGIQNELGNKTFLLDGAFVTLIERGAIDILLCFKDKADNFDSKVNITNDYRFPTIKFSLDFGKFDSDKVETVYSPETTFNQSTVVFDDIWEDKGNSGELSYQKMHEAIRTPDKCYHYEWKEYVLMDSALKLLVNCICFLNSTDKDVDLTTTNTQATELIKELSKTSKTIEKAKISDKLKKFSYSKIHFLGNSLKNYLTDLKSGNEVDPHWRRGHWRNQPFGAGLNQTKLIWIKPTIVRKDKGDPNGGHIYEV
ncbi:MAG: hypothetical protein EAZ53_03210 [Bacteroidetes bacterium]|nr:MAG: hypothetical protein EAZ53_03210 [Bacteroidota bacterium]